MAPEAPVAPQPTNEGVNPAAIPAGARAEFGPQAMDPNTERELAALEARINGQTPTTPEPPPAPGPTPTAPIQAAQPQAPSPQPAAPAQAQGQPQGIPIPDALQGQVPQKFKNPDGTLNEERLQKSLVNLESYLDLERKLSRGGGAPPEAVPAQPQPQMPAAPSPFAGAPPPQGYPQGAWPQPQPGTPPYGYPPQMMPPWMPPPVPLEQQVNQDIQRDPGSTVVNLMRAAVMQAERSSAAQIHDLRRKLELMEIAQKDPGVFSEEGKQRIQQTLVANPWLWASPTPFASAYQMSGGAVSPRTDTPAAAPQRRPTAPILPGGQAPSVPQGVSITSEADLRRHLSERYPNDPLKQAEFLERVVMEMSQRR